MNQELLRLVDGLARDRNIDREVMLDDLEAAMLSQFKPAKLDGEPTKSRVAIPYQFRLDG